MILEFSIGNFRSFNDVQTLDFRATGLVSDDKATDKNNIVERGGQRVIKTVGLYGPNGSGKSNLVSGLRLFCDLVESSLKSEAIMELSVEPFSLSSEKATHEGFYQMQLLINEKKYRYGFTLKDPGEVKQEWLFGPAGKNETWYFKRTGNDVECNKEWFEEGVRAPHENLRSSTLFLTFISAYNGQISQDIKGFIAKNILFEDSRNEVSKQALKSLLRGQNAANNTGLFPEEYWQTNQLIREGKANVVLDWLNNAGLFYAGISLREFHRGIDNVIVEKHIYNKDGSISGKASMDFEINESAGTKKFYYYIGTLFKLFSEGGLIVSDEIDNNFHPSLLQRLLRFFNDPAINKAGAQLLFTSHDTNLLHPDILRRDQIYFAEKSSGEETILYSLADLKGIRNNADFARQYLAGLYGALPLLASYKEQSAE